MLAEESILRIAGNVFKKVALIRNPMKHKRNQYLEYIEQPLEQGLVNLINEIVADDQQHMRKIVQRQIYDNEQGRGRKNSNSQRDKSQILRIMNQLGDFPKGNIDDSLILQKFLDVVLDKIAKAKDNFLEFIRLNNHSWQIMFEYLLSAFYEDEGADEGLLFLIECSPFSKEYLKDRIIEFMERFDDSEAINSKKAVNDGVLDQSGSVSGKAAYEIFSGNFGGENKKYEKYLRSALRSKEAIDAAAKYAKTNIKKENLSEAFIDNIYKAMQNYFDGGALA